MSEPAQKPLPVVKEALRRHYWKIFLGALAIGCVGFSLGVLGVMQSQCMEAHPPAQIMQQGITSDSSGIRFNGAISTESMNALIASIRARQKAYPDRGITVWLESGGGDVEAAMYAAAMMPSLHVTMGIGKHGYCGSSCVLLFLSTDLRFADPTAGIGLHAPYCTGRLADLQCLAAKDYAISAGRYQHFVAVRDPQLYALAVKEHAFLNPPDNLVCFTYPSGADRAPVSERESDTVRGDCAVALDQLPKMLNHDALGRPQHEVCPTSTWNEIGMLLRYYLGIAEVTSRHSVPFPETPLLPKSNR